MNHISNFTLDNTIQATIEESTNFDPLKHFGIFQELISFYLTATNNTGSMLVSLLDKIKYLKPYSHILDLVGQISECFGQIIGFVDTAYIAVKIFCVNRWAAAARSKMSDLKNNEIAKLPNGQKLPLELLNFIKEQESKILAEELTSYYDLRRLFLGSLAQASSTIGFIASFIPSISSLFLLPLKAITDVFNFAVACVNKFESNCIVRIQNRLINHIDKEKISSNLSEAEFEKIDETKKTDAFFRKAISVRIHRENKFIQFLSFKNTILSFYSWIAASFGVVITIAVLAGGPIAPLGLLMVGVSSISIAIIAGLFCLQQGLLLYYKRDFFLASLTGSNSRLICYRVIYNALKCFANPEAWWMKSFKDNWVGKHKTTSEEAGWNDLLRFMPKAFKTYAVKHEFSAKKMKEWVKNSHDSDDQFLHPSLLNETSFYIDALLQWSYL